MFSFDEPTTPVHVSKEQQTLKTDFASNKVRHKLTLLGQEKCVQHNWHLHGEGKVCPIARITLPIWNKPFSHIRDNTLSNHSKV